MSFIDCLVEQLELGGGLTGRQVKAITKEYDKLVDKYTKAGNPNPTDAAIDVISKKAREQYQRNRNKVRQTVAIANIKKEIDSMTGSYNGRGREFLQRVYYRTESVEREIWQAMNDLVDRLAPKFGDFSRDYEGFNRIVAKVIDGDLSTPEAKALSEALNYLHKNYTNEGGILGYIENYFPMSHSKRAIEREDKEVWSKFIYDRLNRNKMIDPETGMPFDDETLKKIISHSYDRISTDGYIDDVIALEKGKISFGGDMDTRRNNSRFFIFKDSESYFEYTTKYGQGENGVLPAFLNHTRSMTRDIGIMQKMGPKPKISMRFIDELMRLNGASVNGRRTANAMFHFLRSSGETSPEHGWAWRVFSGSTSLVRMAQLGSAGLSAIPDTFYVAYTAKINGLSSTRALRNYFKYVFLPSSAKSFTKRTGFIAERINGSVIADARFVGDVSGGGGALTKGAAMVNELSGLANMTRAGKDSVTMEALATVAENVGKPWSKLDRGLRDGLSRFGMNEKTWAQISKEDFFDMGDAQFLNLNGMVVGGKKDASFAISDWIFDLRQKATNEGTLLSRTIVSGEIFGEGAGKAGTPTRALATTMFMYKNFPISVMQNHIAPLFLKETPNRLARASSIFVFTSILGTLSYQLKQITQGKTPEDMFDAEGNLRPRAVANGIVQGGSFGLMSEAVFGKGFFGAGITERMLLGPVAGFVDQIFDLTVGNLIDRYIDGKDPKFGKDLSKFIGDNIPFQNLFYGGLLMDRVILDKVNNTLDTDHAKRLRNFERKMMREKGQEFWWRPGDEPRPEKINESIQKNIDRSTRSTDDIFLGSVEIPPQAVAIIKEFEGFRAEPYKDEAGVATIGYGTTRYPDGTRVTMNDPAISEKQASQFMAISMEEAAEDVDELVEIELNDRQRAALISFVYNFGRPEFKKSTMLKLINSGRLEDAAEQFDRWNMAGGKVSRGLVRRRAAEKALFAGADVLDNEEMT